jgi:hypothetical protein
MRKEEQNQQELGKPKPKTAKKSARHADPADGFLAALLEIQPA